MNRSILSMIRVCPACNGSYIPEYQETCRCPVEEPKVYDWEDHPALVVEAAAP